MAIEVFNRYEKKYLLNEETYRKILKIMDVKMVLDSHNKNHTPYTITNIYYDTEDNYLIRKSLEKPEYKEKLRLRAYGTPKPDSLVFLEIKKKFNGLVNKRRTTISLEEAYEFIRTGKAPELKDYMNPQVIKEIEYFLKVYDLVPKTYLAYDRIAYFAKDDPDLRISFDRNVRARRYEVRSEAGDHGRLLLSPNTYLMEIKSARAMPLWLTEALSALQIKRVSFSKYGTEFKTRNETAGVKIAV